MKKPDCNTIFEFYQHWMEAQPPILDRGEPIGTPRTKYFEELEGFRLCLPLHFPRKAFTQGGTNYGWVGDEETGLFWIKINDDFEELMAAWRARLGPSYDAHMMDYRREGQKPESWRVLREHLLRSSYTQTADQPWEPSREFTVMGTIVDCRTLVPDGDVCDIGWVINPTGLYRPDEGLVLIDPDTQEVHSFGMEPAELPTFLDDADL